MKKIKIGFLSASVFSNNMGCNALTYGSLEILSEVAIALEIEFEYYLIGNPPSGVIPDELKKHNIVLVDGIPDLSLRGLASGIVRRNLSKQKERDTLLRNMDFFIDSAWGDSFSDIYGVGRFNTITNGIGYVFKRKKPLVLFPQTIGPFKHQKVKLKASAILKCAHTVYSRDSLSTACVKELAPAIDVSETIDVAMFMPYQKTGTIHSEKGKILVGLNPSGLLWKGGYTGKNEFGLKDDYATIIRNIIKQLIDCGNVTIVLTGHDIIGPNAGNLEDDYYICKLLQREFPSCKIAPFFYSPVEAKSFISSLDMLIGSRMHCCIAAYSSGIPVYPLAYSRKFEGLFKEKLQYPFLGNLLKKNSSEIYTDIIDLVSNCTNLKNDMAKRMEELIIYRNTLVDDLKHKIKSILK